MNTNGWLTKLTAFIVAICATGTFVWQLYITSSELITDVQKYFIINLLLFILLFAYIELRFEKKRVIS